MSEVFENRNTYKATTIIQNGVLVEVRTRLHNVKSLSFEGEGKGGDYLIPILDYTRHIVCIFRTERLKEYRPFLFNQNKKLPEPTNPSMSSKLKKVFGCNLWLVCM